MDYTIKIQLPKSAWFLQMTTAGNAIIVRITFNITMPNGGTVSTVIDRTWFSVSSWETDMRKRLGRIVNEKDAIVQSRIRMPRYSANETERRLWEVLFQILEIPAR